MQLKLSKLNFNCFIANNKAGLSNVYMKIAKLQFFNTILRDNYNLNKR